MSAYYGARVHVIQDGKIVKGYQELGYKVLSEEEGQARGLAPMNPLKGPSLVLVTE